ncbi:hypothetical protein NUU61_000202 [Penicillium alfredii]|uniref:Uncharacterized protein n=1 Tax=Penicillium alfredii TaxID=1506179 RepID=A0A9W9G9A1_9EURO|nr:uncharacterized protein NUU61_000202 [Penicillium alfredii]KAJ5114443.1 hypothetical protein NUU61_000202 [Penicillium alfredii]
MWDSAGGDDGQVMLSVAEQYFGLCHIVNTPVNKDYTLQHTSLDLSIHNSVQQTIPMTTSSTSSSSSFPQARLQNDFGADYWVRNSAHAHRHSTAGRGLFAGLQDVKQYNVEHGWARRKSGDVQSGLLGNLWSRYVYNSTLI